jgi:hypothetical protein
MYSRPHSARRSTESADAAFAAATDQLPSTDAGHDQGGESCRPGPKASTSSGPGGTRTQRRPCTPNRHSEPASIDATGRRSRRPHRQNARRRKRGNNRPFGRPDVVPFHYCDVKAASGTRTRVSGVHVVPSSIRRAKTFPCRRQSRAGSARGDRRSRLALGPRPTPATWAARDAGCARPGATRPGSVSRTRSTHGRGFRRDRGSPTYLSADALARPGLAGVSAARALRVGQGP